MAANAGARKAENLIKLNKLDYGVEAGLGFHFYYPYFVLSAELFQNKRQYDRVVDLIRDAKDKGYQFLTGGESADVPGYFIPVTILDNPPEDSRIVQEEQFGPVLPLMKFDDLDEAVRRANATEFGLGGSVWGGDEDRALEIAQQIASGTVWVNEAQHLSPMAAFGGMKQSGVGVENGVAGLLEYTNTQTIVRKKKLVAA